MKKEGYYSAGEFARIAHITKKTVRYYDEHHILKPAFVTASGARFYTDAELARLQQILLLKYLGFSLDDIREITVNAEDKSFMLESMRLQHKLVEDRMEQLQVIADTLRSTMEAVEKEEAVDWSHMLDLIHDMGLEKSLRNQYRNASNISSRISLHKMYSVNKTGWFPWIYSQCRISDHMKILELGCGDGTLWKENLEKLPENCRVILSDISEGMVRDARRMLSGMEGAASRRFSFTVFDCQDIPYDDESFDLVIANHVLFYCDSLERTCSEIRRVLKQGGKFVCSTYGKEHMKEVSLLASGFDDRIVLSANKLYDRFGRENGREVLEEYFGEIRWISYEDALCVTEAEPLISYILSCHGNQNQYIPDKYKEFRAYVKKNTMDGFYITKDAGVFFCEKL